MLYGRMLFGMLVSLYTSRVVLRALGVNDFGIYNVVGGLVLMFSMISNSLSSSVSRFLTFELGKGDMNRLKKVFSTSLLIHLILALIMLLLMETFGVWFLNTRMTIPTERLYAANWVFQCSVASFMVGLISVPYKASIISHEHMGTFAYIGIMQVCLRLLIILFIAYCHWNYDGLIVYSVLLLGITLLLQGIYLSYCKRFEECNLCWEFERKYVKEMGAFAGWNFIGCSAVQLKEQGVDILLNLFSGPILNAAKGIAGSVNNAVTSFASQFMMALNPQITKSYACNDNKYMFMLVERGSRFSFYIILLFALPILFETKFILDIWLVDYPAHTIAFVRLALILSLLDVLSNTLITLQNATGRIRNYQIVIGGTLMLNFPLSYVCLKLQFPPESVFYVAITLSIFSMLLRLLFLKKMANLDMMAFLKSVCCKVALVTVVSLILPSLIFYRMPDGLTRFIAVSFICVASSSISSFFLGCVESERRFVVSSVRNLLYRLGLVAK